MSDNPHVRATDQPAPGEELAGYRIEELTGRGGMGEVYRAHDPRLDRNVALKVLAPRYAEDDDFRDRLLRESRLAASLDHPNVIPVYDAGEVDGRLYLAMRYVEGTDLGKILREDGVLAPERAVAFAEQMADALDAAHERGLVHRDVKPSNILIDRRGHAYLADFGLTQSVSDRGPTDGSLMGTIGYIAPEQIRGETVDGRADQYALGCLLFECLTGTLPYQGRSDLAAMFAHLEEPVPSATKRLASLPPAIDEVLARAMAKEPAERYETCQELVEEARAALGLETRRRGLRLAVAAASAAVLAVAGLVSALLLTGSSPSVAATGSLIRIDPETGGVTARYSVSAHPGVITTSAGRVWLGDFLEAALWRLEPRSGELKRVPPAGEPRDLTSLDGKVYVASDGAEPFTGTIARYDAVTGLREGGLNLVACGVAAGAETVWSCGVPNVNRLSTDEGKLRILRTVRLPYRKQTSVETSRVVQRDIAVGFGSAWVIGDGVDRRLWRVHVTSGRIIATVELPSIARTVATGEGAVWVSAPLDDRVFRIDPETNRITATIPTGRGTSGVAAGVGSVWVTNTIDGTVSRIDPSANRVVDEIEVGGYPREVAVGSGGVWVGADAR
jgi:YVTN family beta-propeller protein